ncbi:hypothetical protein [Burkholderia gladioli]|uniref:hypothetical protein n=1 Tax=Burkholderia gladioli TaxID=28095 RepID=UPI0034DB38CC
MRTTTHNALLAAANQPPRLRRAIEAAVWMLAYGVGAGALWYSAVLARAEGLL